MFAAIRRASSLLSNSAADRRRRNQSSDGDSDCQLLHVIAPENMQNLYHAACRGAVAA
jgi:hypothetical protein